MITAPVQVGIKVTLGEEAHARCSSTLEEAIATGSIATYLALLRDLQEPTPAVAAQFTRRQ
jgi:hypothetical protein